MRDPKKLITMSNFHRYCADSGYMPAEVHSDYVSICVLYELPGVLARCYSELRSSLDPILQERAIYYYKKL